MARLARAAKWIALIPVKAVLLALCLVLLVSGLIHIPLIRAGAWLADRCYGVGKWPGYDDKFRDG